jgi:thioredoxin 1
MSNDVIQMKFNKVTKLSAEWCGPCRQYAPIFKEVTEGITDDWNVITLDIDTSEGKHFAEKFGIRGVPATVIERRGENPKVIPGAMDKHTLTKLFS